MVMVMVISPNALLTTATQLERSTHQIRSKGALVPRTNIQLRVGWLGTQLKIGILHRIADSVNARQKGRRKKVLAEKVATSRRVQATPLVVGVTGKKVRRVGDWEISSTTSDEGGATLPSH